MRAFAAYLYGRSLATEITFGYHASEFLRFLCVDGLKAGNSVSSRPTRVRLFVCPEFLVQTFNEASVVLQKANECLPIRVEVFFDLSGYRLQLTCLTSFIDEGVYPITEQLQYQCESVNCPHEGLSINIHSVRQARQLSG